MIKKCKICGTEFEAKSNRACYCSDECKKEGRKATNRKEYLKRKDEGYDYNKFNRLNPDKKNKWNREHIFESNKFNRLNPDKANKWNDNKLEDTRQQFNEINDGYNSSLRINEKRELTEAYGSKEAEKESRKYNINNKKEWAKAEKQMKPLF